jgi:hypothetical protein
MNFVRLCALGGVVMVASCGALGQTTYVETFDDGMNHTGWTWDRTAAGSIEPAGGNPGGFFQSDLQAIPNLFSSDALFTGDFRARAVGSLGGDLRTGEFASRAGPISNILAHQNGTAADPSDDSFAHFVTSTPAPVTPGAGWVSFDVAVPFESVPTPTGWVMTGLLPFQPAPDSWDTLITNVDEVIFAWGNSLQPQLLFDVVRGGDNLRVTYNVPGPACAAIVGGIAVLMSRRRRVPACS